MINPQSTQDSLFWCNYGLIILTWLWAYYFDADPLPKSNPKTIDHTQMTISQLSRSFVGFNINILNRHPKPTLKFALGSTLDIDIGIDIGTDIEIDIEFWCVEIWLSGFDCHGLTADHIVGCVVYHVVDRTVCRVIVERIICYTSIHTAKKHTTKQAYHQTSTPPNTPRNTRPNTQSNTQTNTQTNTPPNTRPKRFFSDWRCLVRCHAWDYYNDMFSINY